MTKKEIRSFLAEYPRLKDRITLLTDELAVLTSAAGAVQGLDDGSGCIAEMDAAIAKAVRRLSAEIQKAAERCDAILECISVIEDPVVRVMMEHHYLGGAKYKAVASMMRCSQSTVKRMHRCGIEEIENRYNEM